MSVLTKYNPNMFTLDKSRAREFIEEFNKNVVNDEFWKECEQIAKYFRKRKIR